MAAFSPSCVAVSGWLIFFEIFVHPFWLNCMSDGWLIHFTSCQHNEGYVDGGSQCTIFPGGHPSKYKPWSTWLNFSERATELALVATAHIISLMANWLKAGRLVSIEVAYTPSPADLTTRKDERWRLDPFKASNIFFTGCQHAHCHCEHRCYR